jgi:hypothetical protein
MALWLWSLNGESLESRGNLGGALDGFTVFDTLDVTLVRVLVGGADSDNVLI